MSHKYVLFSNRLVTRFGPGQIHWPNICNCFASVAKNAVRVISTRSTSECQRKYPVTDLRHISALNQWRWDTVNQVHRRVVASKPDCSTDLLNL
jgi:hypothetical protein